MKKNLKVYLLFFAMDRCVFEDAEMRRGMMQSESAAGRKHVINAGKGVVLLQNGGFSCESTFYSAHVEGLAK